MTTAVLNYLRVQKNTKSKIRSVDLPSASWKAVCFAGFFIILALLVFYVWQVNALTGGYYSLSSYEKQIAQLSNENKTLQVSFAENSFLGQALEKVRALNFQKTSSVKYIQIPSSSVAVK